MPVLQRSVTLAAVKGTRCPGAHPPPPASSQSHQPLKDVRKQPFLPLPCPNLRQETLLRSQNKCTKKNQNVSNVAFQKPVVISETTVVLYQGQKQAHWSLRVSDKEEPVWAIRQLHKIIPFQSWMGPPRASWFSPLWRRCLPRTLSYISSVTSAQHFTCPKSITGLLLVHICSCPQQPSEATRCQLKPLTCLFSSLNVILK